MTSVLRKSQTNNWDLKEWFFEAGGSLYKTIELYKFNKEMTFWVMHPFNQNWKLDSLVSGGFWGKPSLWIFSVEISPPIHSRHHVAEHA